jgi:predicted Zn-dependent protease
VVQQQVSAVAGTPDVSVNLQNGTVLSIAIGSSAGTGKPIAEQQNLPRRVATVAYLGFNSRAQLQAVTVVRIQRRTRYGFLTYTVTTDPQRFRPFDLIERSDLTEHWKAPATSNRLYLVAVGDVEHDLVENLVTHFRRTLSINVEELPAVLFDRVTVDADRSQVVAEDVLSAVRRRYPALARDAHARVIAVTGDDMYLRSMAWAFGFSRRSDDDRMAVVSYARMDPAVLGLPPDPDMLRSRVTKMVAKDIGVIYYGLPLSDNPRSALYSKIDGTDELDVMTEYFDPR